MLVAAPDAARHGHRPGARRLRRAGRSRERGLQAMQLELLVPRSGRIPARSSSGLVRPQRLPARCAPAASTTTIRSSRRCWPRRATSRSTRSRCAGAGAPPWARSRRNALTLRRNIWRRTQRADTIRAPLAGLPRPTLDWTTPHRRAHRDEVQPAADSAGWVHAPALAATLEAGSRARSRCWPPAPGAGKSAMLGAWAAQRESRGRVGWLSLDAADARPAPVLARRARGAGRAAARRSRSRRWRSTPPRRVDLRRPGAGQRAGRSSTEPVVLVLDDLHELGDARRARRPRPAAAPSAGGAADRGRRPASTRRCGSARLRVAGELTEIRERRPRVHGGGDRRAADGGRRRPGAEPTSRSSGSAPRAGRPACASRR